MHETIAEDKRYNEEEKSKSQTLEILSQFGRNSHASDERTRYGQVQINKFCELVKTSFNIRVQFN
jgi:hypothetical protein